MILLLCVLWVAQCSGLLMLCVGIYMKMQLHNYADVGIENSGGALLALSCLGAQVALVGMLACCCTARQHPALLYLVSVSPSTTCWLASLLRGA